MSAGLSKLATALTVVFAVSLAVLIGDLLYVLWRRRRFRQRSSDDPFQSHSKTLLYFFCSWKNRCRIEPDAAAATDADPRPPPPGEPPLTAAAEEEEDVVAKWQQGLYARGPCRFLFTIKEEEEKEREDLESEKRKSSSCDRFVADHHQAYHQVSSTVVVEIGGDDHATTPFSTPCGSPPYYTPSPSPSRNDTTSSVAVETHVTVENIELMAV